MSNNLGRTNVVVAQTGKEVTIATSDDLIDAAMTEQLTLTWAGAETLKTASSAQTQQAICIRFAGATSGTPSFKFGDVQRGVMLVRNDMGVNVDVSDYSSATTITVAAGTVIAVYVTQTGVYTILESAGSLTQEQVEDFAAAMLTGGTHSGISFSYNDGAGVIDATVSVSGYTAENARDDIGAALVAGTGISIVLDDPGDTITINSTITQYTDELVDDRVAALLVAGSNITLTYDDGAGTLTIDAAGGSYSTENAQDDIDAMFTAGTHDGVSFSYNDAGNAMSVTAKPIECLMFAISDETTALTTGVKLAVRMPYAFTLTGIRASLTTAGSTGTTIDVLEGGVSIMTTDKLNFDASGKTTTTYSGTAATLTDTSLADDAEITFDITTAGTSAAGAKVYLIGRRT